MPRLYLLRHGSAAGTPAGAGDIERPLSDEGIEDAKTMGRYLVESGAEPGLVLCSPATRVAETLEHVSAAFAAPLTAEVERSLYTAAPGGILEVIRRAGAAHAQMMVIGHNPALQGLALALCGRANPQGLAALAASFPAGALAVIEFGSADWTGVGLRGGILIAVVTPEQAAKAETQG